MYIWLYAWIFVYWLSKSSPLRLRSSGMWCHSCLVDRYLLLPTSTLRMEAAGHTKTSVSAYHTTWHHIPQLWEPQTSYTVTFCWPLLLIRLSSQVCLWLGVIDIAVVFRLVRGAVWMETARLPTNVLVTKVTGRRTHTLTSVYLDVRRAVSMATAQHQTSALVIRVSHSSLALLVNKCSCLSTVLLQGYLLLDDRMTVFQKWGLTWSYCPSYYLK